MFRPFFVLVALMFVSAPSIAANATVAIASNFSHTAKALQPHFERASGHTLTLVFGATGKLYAQIRHGAPFDVFLSADSQTATLLVAQKLAVNHSHVTYAHGQLALWVPASTAQVTVNALKNTAASAKLAIANPKLAPYGAAAEAALQQLAVTEPKQLVVGENIAQAFQFVATGNAELGLVAYSQLLSQQVPSNQYWLVTPDLYPAIRQDAVLLNRAHNNDAARAFIAFLASDTAKAIIRLQGYQVD